MPIHNVAVAQRGMQEHIIHVQEEISKLEQHLEIALQETQDEFVETTIQDMQQLQQRLSVLTDIWDLLINNF